MNKKNSVLGKILILVILILAAGFYLSPNTAKLQNNINKLFSSKEIQNNQDILRCKNNDDARFSLLPQEINNKGNSSPCLFIGCSGFIY